MDEITKTNTPQTYYVTQARTVDYPDPITMRAGEVIEVSDREDNWHGWIWLWCTNQAGKSGWVPKGYVVQDEGVRKARYDYAATELPIEVGERVEGLQHESGWCRNERGESGWVPAENVAGRPQGSPLHIEEQDM